MQHSTSRRKITYETLITEKIHSMIALFYHQNIKEVLHVLAVLLFLLTGTSGYCYILINVKQFSNWPLCIDDSLIRVSSKT